MQYIFEKDIELRVFRKVQLKIEANSLEEAQEKVNEGDFEGDQEDIVYEHDGDTIEDTERKTIDGDSLVGYRVIIKSSPNLGKQEITFYDISSDKYAINNSWWTRDELIFI